MTDNTGLPTIMENNTSERKNLVTPRPQSMSQRARKAPGVRNVVQSFSIAPSRFVMPPSSSSSSSVRQSGDKFEKINLTMDPE